METTLYPKSPLQIDSNLTALTPSYQGKSTAAILSILVFFILYIGLIIGLGYLVYYAFVYEVEDINKLSILVKLTAIAGSVMLFVFTLKFIFKLKNHVPSNRVELTQKEQPKIWDFINKICDETGAPRPKSIFIDPDVNAYVKYSNTWLSLFLPVQKELTIGMGIINALNLSEFKAVISHEFGHFAQKSMKIGSYIMSANTIVHDMIYARDAWDEALEKWKRMDIRISFGAWIISPIVWGIRQVLALFYQFLNMMYSSLSREMEFNADKVAVKTSGSEAIISALWKLNDANDLWNKTLQHAYVASQKNLYTANLYQHFHEAIEENAVTQRDKWEALPSNKLGGKHFFIGSQHSKVSMYASHPSNDTREISAKTPYIDCEFDNRSPLILFENMEQLQNITTKLVYTQTLEKKPENFLPAEDFKNFIQQEIKSSKLLSEYENTFENRFLNIFPESEYETIISQKSTLNKSDFIELKSELKKLHLPISEIDNQIQLAQEFAMGTTKLKTFEYKKVMYNQKNITNAIIALVKEKNELVESNFPEWDKKFAAFHLALANQFDQKSILWAYYKQHEILNDFFKLLLGVKNNLHEKLDGLRSSEEVLPTDLNNFSNHAKAYFEQLNEKLNSWDATSFIPLPNIETFEELKDTIITGGIFEPEKGAIFENGGLNRIFVKLENATLQLQRLDQKSIGEILTLHQELEMKLD